MTSVLMASGFKNLETLQDFCNRFPNIWAQLDKDLSKIWVCHKSDEIPINEEINLLPYEDYYCLSKKIKKKINAGKQFYSFLSQFSAFLIFNKIYSQFKEQIATYLFTKCYLFYNWGINAFEPVIDHFEIHDKIQKRQKQSFKYSRKIVDQNFYAQNFFKGQNYQNNSIKSTEETILGSHKHSKIVSFRSIVKASKKVGKYYDILKNPRNSYHETFNLTKILYDLKQRPKWPRKHILSKNNVEDLIRFIIQIRVVADCLIESKLLDEYHNWDVLRELLCRFIENHNKIIKHDGYGRKLKKHLKSVKTPPGRRLVAIPKQSVCSYVLDILRDVFPVEFFGKNGVRKGFFSELIRVIKGNKGENFIWYPVLRSLLKNKSLLPWCSQLGDNYTQTQMILKLFIFVIVHYVFVILRNYFYITETGSSGFGLRYYRKSDMERVSSDCLKNLLKKGHIRPLKRKDFESSSLERKWLNTGSIDEGDLKRKLKKIMNANSEYKQSVAHVRFLPKSDDSDELRIITNITQKISSTKLESKNKKLEKYFNARLSHRKKNLFLVKLFLEFLVDKIGFGFRPLPCNPKLEESWKKALYLKEKSGKLYFVKADISDAFGSVKYDILAEMLRSAFENEANCGNIQLMKITEWKRRNGKVQKVVRFSFSSRPRENSVMINRSGFYHQNRKLLDLKVLEIIEQVVMQQKVEIKGRIFKLIKGLAQGSAGKFSPQLCEIYYSSVDNIFFGEFINSNDSIFMRGVDDYLFITPDLEKAKRFLSLVRQGFPEYSVRFNNHKLKTNVFEDVQEVSYLGLSFNFENMFVKPNYLKYQERDYLTTVNFLDKWGRNHFNKQLFLQKRLLRVRCLKLHSIVVDGIHNNLKTARRTVFEACLMQSLRVVSLANYLYAGSAKNDFAVYQILLISCSKIRRLVGPSELSTEEVNWLFFFATLNILRKYSGQFKLLLLIIRFRLQKCEKEFVKNDSQLVFNFLKEDVLDEEYWMRVREKFRELGNLPVKVTSCC